MNRDGVVVVVDVVEEGHVAGQLQHGHERPKGEEEVHCWLLIGVNGLSQFLNMYQRAFGWGTYI